MMMKEHFTLFHAIFQFASSLQYNRNVNNLITVLKIH